MNNCETLLEKAQIARDQGEITKAVEFYKQALDQSGENQGQVLYEIGLFLFSLGKYAEALESFIKCHALHYRTEQVEEIIMEAYYEPNIDEFKENYERNINLLKQYPYINKYNYPDFSELRFRYIPFSDSEFVAFDLQTKEFSYRIDLNQNAGRIGNFKPNNVVILLDEYNLNLCLKYEELTRDSTLLLTMKIPLYLYYNNPERFQHYLQLSDLTELLTSERVVFLFGHQELEDWFTNPNTIIPGYILNLKEHPQMHEYFLNKLENNKINKENLKKKIDHYYKHLSIHEIKTKIKSKKLKILFVTSRFTTALQYYTRDCALACDNLGIENKLFIEESDVHRNRDLGWLAIMDSFRPDMVFVIDHFKYEYPWAPDNVLFITWIQDPLDHILSKETPEKLTPREFVMNLFFSSKEFNQLGYPDEKLIDAIIPINPLLYKEYDLTQQEFDAYSTDICLFSNAGNPEKGLFEVLQQFTNSEHSHLVEQVFRGAYQEVYQMIYQEKPIFSISMYEELLRNWLAKFNLFVSEDYFKYIAKNFRNVVAYRIMRSVPIEWLHEKGYKMKLWGKEWLEHPKLSSYAQGVAPNGEILSKIINASKIVIGTNTHISSHPRIFETILSNSFYLGVNIPVEHDWANIRKYFQEDYEIVFFNGREDLYRKVDYYLSHEKERAKIIAKSQKKVLEHFTYEAMMSRVLNEIGDRLENVKENDLHDGT